ncbi:MAG: hypothetical protein IPO58_18910 [Betaproteobacteria bacterium]|nr:hypothetical protein [Betaproteobacteria bacterium]MBK8739717.1 hypothetical protein [Betaproteobacteria bacterium]MBK9608406.1 hypothetical protein [Betaproteobacteria bacterium]
MVGVHDLGCSISPERLLQHFDGMAGFERNGNAPGKRPAARNVNNR